MANNSRTGDIRNRSQKNMQFTDLCEKMDDLQSVDAIKDILKNRAENTDMSSNDLISVNTALLLLPMMNITTKELGVRLDKHDLVIIII